MGRPKLGALKADRAYTVRFTEAEADLFDLVLGDESPSAVVRRWLQESLCVGSNLPGYRPKHRGPGAQGREVVCTRCFRKFPTRAERGKARVLVLHTREGLVLEKTRSAKSKSTSQKATPSAKVQTATMRTP
jgi:hypothetical protein